MLSNTGKGSAKGGGKGSALPSGYRASNRKDSVKITGPDKSAIEISKNSEPPVVELLNLFETIKPGSLFRLVDVFSEKSVSFEIDALADISAAVRAFSIRRIAEETPAAAPEPIVLPPVSKEASERLAVAPKWIRDMQEVKASLVGDDGDFTLQFMPLKCSDVAKHSVESPAADCSVPTWGYEVTRPSGHFGWIIIESEKSFVVSGFGERKSSSHRTLDSAMIRISSFIQGERAAGEQD
jgi:hypothetical protein